MLSVVCWFPRCRSTSNACFIYDIFRLCKFFPRELSLQLSYLFQGWCSAFSTGFIPHTFVGCFLTVAISVCSPSCQSTIHDVIFSAPQSSQKTAVLWTLAFELILRKKVSTRRISIQQPGFFEGTMGILRTVPDALVKNPDLQLVRTLWLW